MNWFLSALSEKRETGKASDPFKEFFASEAGPILDTAISDFRQTDTGKELTYRAAVQTITDIVRNPWFWVITIGAFLFLKIGVRK